MKCFGTSYLAYSELWLSVHHKFQIEETKCHVCLLGGRCHSGRVMALNDNWGYKKGTEIVFIKCKSGYSCPHLECMTFSSCAENRIGTVCSKCIDNSLLGLKTDTCYPKGKCKSNLVWPIMFINAMVFAILILFKNDFGAKIHLVLKRFMRYRRCKVSIANIDNEESYKTNDNIEDGSLLSRLLLIYYHGFWYIVIYHMQDAKLFHATVSDSKFSQILATKPAVREFFSLPILLSRDSCLPGINAIVKSICQLSLIPFVMFLFCLIYLTIYILRTTSVRFSATIWQIRLFTGILILISLFFQRIAITLFTLISCVYVNDNRHLLLHGETECWQFWQVWIIIYIIFSILLQWLVFLLGPNLLYEKSISFVEFVFAIFVPFPFLIYWLIKSCPKIQMNATRMNHRRNEPTVFEKNVLEEIFGLFDLDKFPYSMCWIGFVQIRRLTLVLAHIFIGNQVTKIFLMTLISISAVIIEISVKPYKDQLLNMLSFISLLSLVSSINLAFSIIDYSETEIPIFAVPVINTFLLTEEVFSFWVLLFLLILKIFSICMVISKQTTPETNKKDIENVSNKYTSKKGKIGTCSKFTASKDA